MDTGFVDIHHHLLHGLDDGPASFEQTARMLHSLTAQGVTHVAATPHLAPGLTEFRYDLYMQRLYDARAYVQQYHLPVCIYSGAEVLYTGAVKSYLQQGKIPLLGNSYHVLVEFHPRESYDVIHHAIVSICNTGHGAVLAHAERYPALRWGDRLSRLKEQCRVKVQMNCDTLIAAHQKWGDRWVKRMLREHVVDMAASDAHNMETRACHMQACAKVLSDVYGEGKARRLCMERPLALLNERNNEDVKSE